MDDGQGIKTTVDMKAAFTEAAPGMQLAANEPTKAVSPSQLMNGGKMESNKKNAEFLKIG